jgi:hypothetical protein
VSLVIIGLQLLFDLPTTSPDMTVSHHDELDLFAPLSVFLTNLDCTQPAPGTAQSEYAGDNRNGFELVRCGSENLKGSERREGCDFKYVVANESHRSEPSIGSGSFLNGAYTGSPNVVIGGGVKMGSQNAGAVTKSACPVESEAEQVVMTEDDPLQQRVETGLYRLHEVINSLKIDR